MWWKIFEKKWLKFCKFGENGFSRRSINPKQRKTMPLQYSCLENPMDRGAWRAAVLGTTQSRTWVKQLQSISQSVSQSVQLCPTLCDPMNHSTPGLPVHHQLPEFTQIHAHWVGDTIQPSHPLSSPFPPAPNPSQHQGLFQWVNSSHEVAKVLEFQLQHQSFQWIPRTDL